MAKFSNIRPGYIPRVKVPTPYKPRPSKATKKPKAALEEPKNRMTPA